MHVAPERQAARPQLVLAKLAAVDLAVADRLDRLGAEVDRLRQRAQVRVGAAGAQRLVDRDAEQVGVLAGGHLAEQLLVLAFLDVAVEVGYPAALLGAAVDREHPPVGELELVALAAALERVHEHRQRERLAGEHRGVQPAHRRAPGGVVHEDRLLDVTVDRDLLVRGAKVQAGLGDLRLQTQRRVAGGVPLGGRVELAEHLHVAGGRAAPVVGLGRVEPRPQQMQHPVAVEQVGCHPVGLELGAQRVDVREVLAHRPAVRLQRALERSRAQPVALDPRQRRPGGGLARQVGHDHVRGHLHRGLLVGVQPQRLLERGVQPPLRQRHRVARGLLAARRRPRAGLHLVPARGQQLRQVHRSRVDVDLQRLLRLELRDEPPEAGGGLRALLL